MDTIKLDDKHVRIQENRVQIWDLTDEEMNEIEKNNPKSEISNHEFKDKGLNFKTLTIGNITFFTK